MQAVFHRRRDAKVSATPAKGPEQVRMFIQFGRDQFPVCQDDVHRKQIVEGESMFAHQPADAASKRQATYPCCGYHTSCRGEAVKLRFPVEATPC